MNGNLWDTFDAGKYLSKHRLDSYSHHCGSPRDWYERNLAVSQSFYTPLAVFEIILRNTIHSELSKSFQTDSWWECLRGNVRYRKSIAKIDEVLLRLSRNRKSITPSNVVAELTLGFWVFLFCADYAPELWKPLSKCFWKMPKYTRRRDAVSAPLQRILELRNRIYHYEPVLNKHPETVHEDILLILSWIAPDSLLWLRSIDSVESTIRNGESQ